MKIPNSKALIPTSIVPKMEMNGPMNEYEKPSSRLSTMRMRKSRL